MSKALQRGWIVAAAVVTALAGCATTKTNYQPIAEQVSFPALNERTSVAVGEEMVKQGTYVETKGVFLRDVNNINNYKFSAGFYPQIGEDEKYTYHSFQMGTGLNGIGALHFAGGILAPGNDAVSLRATKGSNELCVDRTWGAKFCDTEHAYERTTRPMVSENNFQQLLIYNGRVGNRVRIGYRELSGNMARPAFSNEVDYDLSKSSEITYRGARIRIIDANNEKIQYVVLSNFNTPR